MENFLGQFWVSFLIPVPFGGFKDLKGFKGFKDNLLITLY